MSKTIDERLHLAFMHEADVVIAANAFKASAANIAADKRDAIRFADWNAAVAVLQQLIDLNYSETAPNATDNHPGWWGCEHCRGEKYHRPDLHVPGTCVVAAAQAALALMDDNSHSHSHSRDEAMVEDKRYERDDIYKK